MGGQTKTIDFLINSFFRALFLGGGPGQMPDGILQDRDFMVECNRISASVRSPGFGDYDSFQGLALQRANGGKRLRSAANSR